MITARRLLSPWLPLPSSARLENLTASRVAQAAVFPLTVALLWQLLPLAKVISPIVMPPLSAVLAELYDLLRSGELIANLQISLLRVAEGFSLGLLIGGSLGLSMGASRRIEQLVLPTFRALCQVPTMAWLPLLMMVFGIGEALKIIVITKSVAIPVCINTFEGVRGIPEKYLEVARVQAIRRSTLFTRLIVPAVMPPIFAGIRQGLSHAWVALVGVELLASTEGIGYLMHWGRLIFQLEVVFAGVVVVGLVGLSMDIGMRAIERRLAAHSEWQVGSVRQETNGGRLSACILPLSLLAWWWLAAHRGWADPRLLPAPEKVLLAPFDPVVRRLVLDGLGASLWLNTEGALLGSALGLLFGAWLGFSQRAERMLGPSFHAFRQIAMFAWIPLLTAWLGIGETMRITFVAIAAFKPMALNAQAGVAGIPQHYLEVGRTMRLSRWSMVRQVLLPAALPSILAGLQLAFISSWLATIGVETLVSFSVGVGAVLREGQEHFHMEVVIFGIALIGALGFLFNSGVQRTSKNMLHWREAGA